MKTALKNLLFSLGSISSTRANGAAQMSETSESNSSYSCGKLRGYYPIIVIPSPFPYPPLSTAFGGQLNPFLFRTIVGGNVE